MPQLVVKTSHQPIIVNVPQTKVVVQSPPTDRWLTYGVPYFELAFAFAAALFAALAWGRMRRQITLATDQINLAKKQIDQQERMLKLATDDLSATLEALGITQRQAKLANAERAKRPDLYIACKGEDSKLHLRAGDHDLYFYVHNRGDKPATEVRAMVYFSDNFVDRLDTIDQIQAMTASIKMLKDRSRFTFDALDNIDGIKMYANTGRANGAVLSKVGSLIGHADVYLKPGKYVVACKLNSAEGEWPENGFQAIEILVE